jgi:hypothetical protein
MRRRWAYGAVAACVLIVVWRWLRDAPAIVGAPSNAARAASTTDVTGGSAFSRLPTLPLVKTSVTRTSPALPDAPPPDTLRASRAFGDSLIFARITAIAEVGAAVVVADAQSSPHITVFDRATGRLMATWGRQGQGPGEMIHPSAIRVDPRDAGLVWVYDFNLRRFVPIRTTPGRPVRPERVMALPRGGSLLEPLLVDGGILSNGLFAEFSLLMLDSVGTPQGTIDLTPPFRPPAVTHYTARRLLNASSLTGDPSRRARLAMAYMFSSELELVDLATGVHTKVIGPRRTRPSFQFNAANNGAFMWNDDNQTAYLSVAASPTFVVGLFCGRRDNDQPAGCADRLHFYRWSGEFAREVVLERHSQVIALSRDGTVLYAASNEPYPAVWIYDLRRLLRSLSMSP